MKIRIAELNIEIFARYPLIQTLCGNYLADFEKADISVCVSEQEIREEMQNAKEPVTAEIAEFACAYRAIAMELPRFSAFVLHAAVVECDGRAYAFSAPSGTGKSTHISLWLKSFADRAHVLNGDKPILRLMNGKWFAFGTPWCGKERFSQNAGAPLVGISFLQRAEQNSIQRLADGEVLKRLFYQIVMPQEEEQTLCFLDLLDDLAKTLPFYVLNCNMSPEAALVAYHGMQKGE